MICLTSKNSSITTELVRENDNNLHANRKTEVDCYQKASKRQGNKRGAFELRQPLRSRTN